MASSASDPCVAPAQKQSSELNGSLIKEKLQIKPIKLIMPKLIVSNSTNLETKENDLENDDDTETTISVLSVKSTSSIPKIHVTINLNKTMIEHPKVLAWCHGERLEDEKDFMRNEYHRLYPTGQIATEKQWTNVIGHVLVEEALKARGETIIASELNASKGSTQIQDLDKLTIKVDIMTNKANYEVKTRNYYTTGTAGEKILFSAIKYADLPALTNKPLYIVLVGYQEDEAVNKFKLFNTLSPNKKKLLKFLNEELNIHFLKMSDLLKV